MLMDEIFGRENFVSTITVKSFTPSGTKTTHKNKTIIKQKDSILFYKNSNDVEINSQYTMKTSWDSHYTKWIDINNGYKLENLIDILIAKNIIDKSIKIKNLDINNYKFKNYYLNNRNNIARLQSHKNEKMKKISKKNNNTVVADISDGETKGLYYNGQVITPLSQSIKNIFTSKVLKTILQCYYVTFGVI